MAVTYARLDRQSLAFQVGDMSKSHDDPILDTRCTQPIIVTDYYRKHS